MDKPVGRMSLAELMDERDRTHLDFEDEVSAVGEDALARLAADELTPQRRRFFLVEAELLRRQTGT